MEKPRSDFFTKSAATTVYADETPFLFKVCTLVTPRSATVVTVSFTFRGASPTWCHGLASVTCLGGRLAPEISPITCNVTKGTAPQVVLIPIFRRKCASRPSLLSFDVLFSESLHSLLLPIRRKSCNGSKLDIGAYRFVFRAVCRTAAMARLVGKHQGS